MTPMDSKSKLSATNRALAADPSEYRSLAGVLQYLTFTCPDLAYMGQQACLFMHNPWEPHLALVNRILCYIKSLTAYSDTD